jgi:two-component system NtrC family response regulator
VNNFDALSTEKMLQYKWPGNVRELENRIRRAVIMTQNKIINCDDLGLFKDISQQKSSLTEIVDDVQKKYIDIALNRTRGNVSRAARDLGISRVTLYDLLHRFNIELTQYRKHNYMYS